MSEAGRAGSEIEALTSDNLLLSEQTNSPASFLAAETLRSSVANCNDPLVREFLEAATAPNTRRAYKSDLEHFRMWGGSIPSNAQQIAQYLAAHARTLAVSTLARRLAAIAVEHRARGFADLGKAELVRLTFRGIRRTFGRPQRRSSALTSEKMKLVLKAMGRSERDIRDKALLLVGFAGAFRRSELCEIRFDWIARTNMGIRIKLPQSKTDQERQGRCVAIASSQSGMCPVAALNHWIEAAKLSEGPIFRRIDRNGQIGKNRLSAEAVGQIVKRRTEAAGLDSERFSGHSLRSGYVTSAIAAGLSTISIRSQTGHSSDALLSRYFRNEELEHGQPQCSVIPTFCS